MELGETQLGSRQIHEDADRPSDPRRCCTHARGSPEVVLVGAVGKVDPGHVKSGIDKALEDADAGGSDRGDEASAA